MTAYSKQIKIIGEIHGESWKISFPKTKHHRHAPDFTLMTVSILPTIKSNSGKKIDSFFVNVGTNLAQKIPPNSQTPTASLIRNINSMAVLPVNESEVIDIIKNLKNSSPGWDSISAKVVKATYPHFIEPLMHIMNLSITQGIYISKGTEVS